MKEAVQMRTTEGRAGEERVRNRDVLKKSPGQFERSSADADCKESCRGRKSPQPRRPEKKSRTIRKKQCRCGPQRCAQMARRHTADYKGAHRWQGVIQQTTKVRTDGKALYSGLQRCAQMARSHSEITIVHSRRIQS